MFYCKGKRTLSLKIRHLRPIPLKQAAVPEGDHVVVGEDEVVGELHPHLPENGPESAGGGQVGLGWEG